MSWRYFAKFHLKFHKQAVIQPSEQIRSTVLCSYRPPATVVIERYASANRTCIHQLEEHVFMIVKIRLI